MGVFFLVIVAPLKQSACFSGGKSVEGPLSLLVAGRPAFLAFLHCNRSGRDLLKEAVYSRASGRTEGTNGNF